VHQRKSAANVFVVIRNPPFFQAGSVWVGILLLGWLRESLPVAFFDAAHASEQMVIRSCPECFTLAVKHLNHQRIEKWPPPPMLLVLAVAN
jgi:hypothetical protein